MWVVLAGDGQLVRVDPSASTATPARRHREMRMPVGKGARRITAGGDAIWVSNPTTQRVLKVDPQTMKVHPVPRDVRGP